MQITATHINYYFICHRKLWLFANGINMEHTSAAVAEGKLLHETAYPQRAQKYSEIELSASLDEGWMAAGKIDFYEAKEKTIHEVKNGDSMEEAHTWQVRFYIWLLTQNGVEGACGRIEYPKLRQITEVHLSGPDTAYLLEAITAIQKIMTEDYCPPRIDSKICRKCSYYDLCYVSEPGL